MLKARFQPADKLAQALTFISDTQYDKTSSLQSYLDKLKLTAMRGGVGTITLLAVTYKNVLDEVKSEIAMARQDNSITWDLVYYIAKYYDEMPRINNFNQYSNAIKTSENKYPMKQNYIKTRNSRYNRNQN
ncbi:hypothetical protein BDAP_000595 [Binucleata daphniae]